MVFSRLFYFAHKSISFGQIIPMRLLIWEKRTEQNISLQRLAMRTGISKTSLYRYENGLRSPNMDQMERIAKALHTTISALFESPYK